ncbi:MAG: AAA family ATPase [bacterium]
MTQEEAFDILKLGYNVFLTGPAGSGKTFLLQKYIRYLKQNGKNVGVTASTGIAATHMNGVTIHSWSGLGIKDEISKEDIRKILKKGFVKKRFKNTGVIIIDEISMLSAKQFDSLNFICRAFKENNLPFGGMQVVCSGDFFQLPPIVPTSSRILDSEAIGKRNGDIPKFAYESNVWSNMDIKICYLEEQYRQKEEDKLLELLNHIRNSRVEEAKNILSVKNFGDALLNIEPAKLYTHNVDVDAINSTELDKISEKENVYFMKISGNKHVSEALKRGCLAPEKLVLKKGAKVMFVKNNFEEGYVNGTMGFVSDFDSDGLPLVKILKGSFIKMDFANWKVEEDGQIKAEISQIPLRLAWAITVHKSQGMNLDSAEIDLSKSFVEGMGYVALSRLRSLSGLKLSGINEMSFMVNKTISEVDKELKIKSENFVSELRAIDSAEKSGRQNDFLHSLPGSGKIKEAKISNYEITRLLVIQKIPLKKMAEQRNLCQDTILRHLEKIAVSCGTSDLEYLRPENGRFDKIRIAFADTGEFKLSPVKEILGDDFSYEEIKLARLFLKN